MKDFALHLPPDQGFECTSCGRCCRAAWTIAVEPRSEAMIRTSQAYQMKVREGFTPLAMLQDVSILGRDSEGACHFLDHDNLCQLHSEIGGDNKPIVCQTYPFFFTQTPDGVFTALSFACPAVSSGDGPSLDQHRESLTVLLESRRSETPQASPVLDRIGFLGASQISWADYRRIEVDIIKAFEPDQPVESLLRIAIQLVAWDRERPAQRAYQSSDLSAPINLGGFDQELTCMVTCNLLALTEDVSDPQERAQLGSFFWNGGIHFSQRFQTELPAFSIRRPTDPAAHALVNRYFHNAVFGKRLLIGSLVSRILALACGIAVVLFYCEAFRRERQEAEVSLETLDRAFTLVEAELLSHTRSFDGFFSEFETALSSVYDSFHPVNS